MSALSMSALIARVVPEHDEVPVTLRGRLPEWLRGTLVRTAAASFHEGSYRAEHLFDALAALYAFDLRDDGTVLYRQQMLDSEMRRRVRAGSMDTPGFYSRMQRPLFKRLLSPVPRSNDNTNVNVLPFGASLVAMTETTVQHEIDPSTLRSKGPVRYDDEHRGKLFMLAHPRFDRARNRVINVATMLSRKSGLLIYEHAPEERRRHVIAELPLAHVPYQHSFGLTSRQVVLFAGPLSVEPWRLLWSERGYIRHFRFRPEQGSRIYRIDRASGEVQTHQAPSLFVFHVINAFEREGATVLDVLAYDDTSVIETLTLSALERSWPEFNGRPLRVTMYDGREQAQVEQLSEQLFEFPTLDEHASEGRPYESTWGACGRPREHGYEGAIVRLDVERGAVARFSEPDYVFGEPLFIRNPRASRAGEGVLLSVASHAATAGGALVVLDAQTLDVLAWGDVAALVPLSFHGCFLTRTPSCPSVA
jgi:beta,beta-carotene 9',10'-dioxygenase